MEAEIPYPHERAYGGGIAIGAGSVWIGIASGPENADGSILRVDPDTNDVIAEIPIAGPTFRHRIAATDDAVWVASTRGDVVQRIDPATNSVIADIDVAGVPSALAADGDTVWVTVIEDRSDEGLQNLGRLVRIDSATDEIVADIPLGTAATGYEDLIILGGGSVWVLGSRLVSMDAEEGGELVRVDPAANTIETTIPIDGFHMVMSQDGKAIWVRSPEDGLFDGSGETWVWRIVDTMTNSVSSPFSFPSQLDAGLSTVDDDALWTVTYDRSESMIVARLDPATLDVQASSVPMDTYFTDAFVDAGGETAWVTTATRGVVRVDLSA